LREKGDLGRASSIYVEVKSTRSAALSFRFAWWDKALRQAAAYGKELVALQLVFTTRYVDSFPALQWLVLAVDDQRRGLPQLKPLWERVVNRASFSFSQHDAQRPPTGPFIVQGAGRRLCFIPDGCWDRAVFKRILDDRARHDVPRPSILR